MLTVALIFGGRSAEHEISLASARFVAQSLDPHKYSVVFVGILRSGAWVVPKDGQDITREEMLEFLAPRMAKWWLPDDVVFVGELPHTATGKLLKTKLREMFRDYRLP